MLLLAIALLGASANAETCEQELKLCDEALVENEKAVESYREAIADQDNHLLSVIKHRNELAEQAADGSSFEDKLFWSVLGVALGVVLVRGIR